MMTKERLAEIETELGTPMMDLDGALKICRRALDDLIAHARETIAGPPYSQRMEGRSITGLLAVRSPTLGEVAAAIMAGQCQGFPEETPARLAKDSVEAAQALLSELARVEAESISKPT